MNVRARPEPLDELARLIAHRNRARQVPAIAPVTGAKQAVLHLEFLAAAHSFVPALQGRRHVLGVQRDLPAPTHRPLHRQAAVFQPAAVHVVGASLGVGGPDHLRDRVGQEAVMLFTAAQGFVQLRIVNRDGGLAGDALHQLLIALAEAPGLGVPEKQPADHLARAADHRDGEIAPDRQMPGRHAVVRRTLSVTRVFGDVIQPHRAGPGERRAEDLGVARHGELFERLARDTRERVEHVRAAAIVAAHVVEERAEGGAGMRGGFVGHELDQPLEIALRRQTRTDAM